MSALSKIVKEGIEILKNPRTRDVISLAKDAPGNQLRVMKSHPDTYYWPAYDAEHDGVRKLLGLPREYTGLTDILTYDKGKFHPEYNKSYIEDAADHHGTNYEDERKDWMMRNFGLPSIAAMLGSGLTDEFSDGIMEEPQEFSAGGLVAKKGAAALKELLESLHKAHPERMKRAEEAGFDTSKVWLHGTNTDELVNEGAFLKPENWFTDNPDVASIYAQRNPYDLEISPNIVPTFIRNAEGKYKFYPKADDPYVNIEVLRRNRGDIRSIFNDFTPESLADEKFAHGGLVRSYPYD